MLKKLAKKAILKEFQTIANPTQKHSEQKSMATQSYRPHTQRRRLIVKPQAHKTTFQEQAQRHEATPKPYFLSRFCISIHFPKKSFLRPKTCKSVNIYAQARVTNVNKL